MKINLIWKKEEIDEDLLSHNKIAVVFDVFLATSTIASCLANGAKQVIPVLERTEASARAKILDHKKAEDVLLTGENDGVTIDGFLDPLPSVLKDQVLNKTVILSTTNGTVAIRKAARAKKVYIASLLNGAAVGKRIAETHQDETIVVICSGSKNAFCLEDYFGAGYFISKLIQEVGQADINLTDSALSAQLFYEQLSDQAVNVLSQSRVGSMLTKYGGYDDLVYVSQTAALDVVPVLNHQTNALTHEAMDHTS